VPYLVGMRTEIVPLIGLNFMGLAFLCGTVLMVVVSAAWCFWCCKNADTESSWHVRAACLAAIFLLAAVTIIIYPPQMRAPGEVINGCLFVLQVLVLIASFHVVTGIDPSDYRDDLEGDDSPEDGDGPPSDSIDWDEFNRARGEWSRPLTFA